jgi:aryl-alcohol dehydrogenase-like predicted oxidoreductase
VTPRRLGAAEIHPVGLGCAALTLDHAGDPGRAREAVHAALDAGMGLLDTAHAYTTFDQTAHNERLIARVLRDVPAGDRPLISTKGGHYRRGDEFPIDGRPQTLRRHCDESLAALGVDRIDLYHLHWPDPRVPLAESVGALAELRQAGKIAGIGLSNVTAAQVAQAAGQVPITSVQNRLSLFHQAGRDVLATCQDRGIAFLAYSPLHGMGTAAAPLLAALDRLAARHHGTRARIALAWLLARSPALIALTGATRAQTVRDSACAPHVSLGRDDLALLDDLAGG